MILMPQIFDVTANENARYKRNELECTVSYLKLSEQYAVKPMFKEHQRDLEKVSIIGRCPLNTGLLFLLKC